MATHTVITTPEPRQQRVFHCHFICDECPNEFEDVLLTAGPSWCPCCDRELDPYLVEEFEEEVVGWEDEDETV